MGEESVSLPFRGDELSAEICHQKLQPVCPHSRERAEMSARTWYMISRAFPGSVMAQALHTTLAGEHKGLGYACPSGKVGRMRDLAGKMLSLGISRAPWH